MWRTRKQGGHSHSRVRHSSAKSPVEQAPKEGKGETRQVPGAVKSRCKGPEVGVCLVLGMQKASRAGGRKRVRGGV